MCVELLAVDSTSERASDEATDNRVVTFRR